MSIYQFRPLNAIPSGACQISNGGVSPYRLGVHTTSGYVAIRNDRGEITTHYSELGSPKFDVPAAKTIQIWSCKSPSEHEPRGDLAMIICEGNQLKFLDFCSCAKITTLCCNDNLLESLDLSSCRALSDVVCSGNRLGELKLGGLRELQRLDCSNNRLRAIDISNCDMLGHGMGSLECDANPIELATLTGAQLDSDLLSRGLGEAGQLKVVCGRSFRKWANAIARTRFPEGWTVDIIDEPSL